MPQSRRVTVRKRIGRATQEGGQRHHGSGPWPAANASGTAYRSRCDRLWARLGVVRLDNAHQTAVEFLGIGDV
jgi:hypothetical protein